MLYYLIIKQYKLQQKELILFLKIIGILKNKNVRLNQHLERICAIALIITNYLIKRHALHPVLFVSDLTLTHVFPH